MGLLRQNHDTPISIPSKCFEHGFVLRGYFGVHRRGATLSNEAVPNASHVCLLRAVSKRRQRNKLGKLKGT